MTTPTATQRLTYLVGRLEGLSSTSRFELPAELRAELKEIAATLSHLSLTSKRNLYSSQRQPRLLPSSLSSLLAWLSLRSSLFIAG